MKNDNFYRARKIIFEMSVVLIKEGLTGEDIRKNISEYVCCPAGEKGREGRLKILIIIFLIFIGGNYCFTTIPTYFGPLLHHAMSAASIPHKNTAQNVPEPPILTNRIP
jgi:hypothetical protein